MKEEIIEKNNKGKEKRKKIERNDVNIKELKQNLEEDIIKTMIIYYSNAQEQDGTIKRFVNYLRHFSKDNKSNNNFNNRLYGLYQYLIEQYSNFKELDKIINVK